MTSVTVLERLSLVAPLGVCFWDDVSKSRVCDGLAVSAYPAAQRERRVAAVLNTTGVYAFPSIPGVRALEDAPQQVVVEVTDSLRRFIPFSFTATVPTRGLYSPACGSPPGPLAPGVPLFSAPARSVPAAMAVVRAELWDPLAGAPAAWAVLEVRADGLPPVRGIADDRGRVAVILGYPEPPGPPISSPGPSTGPALTDQTWTVRVLASYAPHSPVPTLPDLCATLSQPAAVVWADAARTRTLTSATLSFGRELLIRSLDASNRPLEQGLLITPTGSPPGSPP